MQRATVRSTTTDSHSSIRLDPPLESAGPGHMVQFYDDDTFLVAAVAEFLAAGLIGGQSVIVIATPDHRRDFAVRLQTRGFDVDRAAGEGRLMMLDAREMLGTFMVDSMPNVERFAAHIGSALANLSSAGERPCVRAYGEMVDLLWKDGNVAAAVRLEELWNDLANRHAFSLLCAYSMSNFSRADDQISFTTICRQHEHVFPTERYTQADESARFLEVSMLQQRARALEGEIEFRKTVERELRDALTSRRTAEETLRRSEQELKRSVAERESLLAREQSARREAEEASRAKSQFLAVMSHELRTPLNAIGGHIQLIEMELHGPVTAEQRQALGRVGRSQRQLLALISNVLNLAAIESGRVEYSFGEVAAAPLLTEITTMLEPIFAASGLTCTVAPAGTEEEPIVVYADREKARQILLNLVTNAIKFTPAGGSITLDAARSEPDMVSLRVRDSGIGIPPEKLEAIFEPFVQLDSRPSNNGHQGVGLGLAISRDLARGMGGDLVAESRGGEGSTLTLTLKSRR